MALSEALRKKLASPFGQVMEFSQAQEKLAEAGRGHKKADDKPATAGKWKDARAPLLVAVGDQTIFNLLQAGLVPDVGIYDLMCQRQAVDIEMSEYILSAAGFAGEPAVVDNPAGTVQPALEKAIEQALLDGKGWIQVEGEDDLAGLVVMARASAKSVLLYGQPHQGVVWVDIDARKKKEARELLEQVKKEQ